MVTTPTGYSSVAMVKQGQRMTPAEVWQAAGDDASSVSQTPQRDFHMSSATLNGTMTCEMLSLNGADDIETIAEIPLNSFYFKKAPLPVVGGDDCSNDSPTNVSSMPRLDSGMAETQAAVHAFNGCIQKLDALWTDMGTPPADRSETLSELWAHMSLVFKAAIEKEKQKHNALSEQVKVSLKKAKQLEQKLCWTPSVSETLEGPLVSQLAVIKAHTEELDHVFDERMSMFKLLRALHEDLGSKRASLPIPSDTSLIVNVTEEEIERCLGVINEVASDREEFLKAALGHESAEVERLWGILKVKESEKTDFHRFLSEVLQHEGESTVRKVTRLSIAQLHRTLQSAPDHVYHPGELASMVCGCEQLQEALNLILDKKEKLTSEYQERLALQVAETKVLLKSLWAEYHKITNDPAYAKDTIERERPIPDMPTEANLTLVEGEVLDMEQKLEAVKTIVASLKKRDELLKEKTALELAAQDKDRLTDRSRNMAQVLIKEEKVRNAIKKELPKLDKQLAQFCEAHRAANGNRPFFYNGTPLETQLGDDTHKDITQPRDARRSRSPGLSTTRRATAASPGPTKKAREQPVPKTPTRTQRPAR